jgi:hypothetical protein
VKAKRATRPPKSPVSRWSAIACWFAFYNFCRILKSLRVTTAGCRNFGSRLDARGRHHPKSPLVLGYKMAACMRLLPILLLMFLTPLQGQKESPPRPRETQQSSAESKQDETPTTNHDHSPITTPILTSSHAPAKGQEATNVATGNKQQSSIDIRSVPRLSVEPVKDWTNYGMWVFTLILVLVGTLQWLVLRRQAMILHEHGELMGQSVTQLQLAVGAYERLAGASEEALGLTRQSNTITREATRLTNQSFILTERPKIIVRNVAVIDAGLLFNRAANAHITGTVFVANVGTTKARVISIFCDVFRGVLPMIPPYVNSDGSKVDIELAPGKGTTWQFETVLPQSTDPEIFRQIATRSAGVYVLGRIGYQDDIGTMRSTAICRKWDVPAARFFPISDPDYEHAE